MRKNEYELPSTGKIIGLIPLFGLTSSRELPWHRHETMSDIIPALSGHHIQRIVIMNHVDGDRNYSGRFLQVPRLNPLIWFPLLRRWVSIEPVLIHNVLYCILDDDVIAEWTIPELYKSLPCLYLLHSGCPPRASSYFTILKFLLGYLEFSKVKKTLLDFNPWRSIILLAITQSPLDRSLRRISPGRPFGISGNPNASAPNQSYHSLGIYWMQSSKIRMIRPQREIEIIELHGEPSKQWPSSRADRVTFTHGSAPCTTINSTLNLSWCHSNKWSR